MRPAISSAGDVPQVDAETRAGAVNVVPPSSDAEKSVARHGTPDGFLSTVSTPSTPLLLTAIVITRRACVSIAPGPTATPGRFHVSPRSAECETTIGPP